ncbi:MAG: flagellar hook-associated protein FlgL [Acidaminococcales bacterium]|jgi:flagellar hook-associated protein 3 FlgL|nr:flagellar hook-associated protein FlgL [Acidaminococcales bacterium]
MQRISTSNMSFQYLTDLNRALVRENKLQEQMASGKTLNRASDDPIRISRSLRFHSALAQNDKYVSNYGDAETWMKNSDDALQTMGSVLIRVKELVVQAANDTNTEDERKSIGTEINKLVDTLVDAANSKVGDRYLFGGQSDRSQPYTRNPDGTVSFAGDNHFISMRLQAGGVSPVQDSINVTCAEAFGADCEMFNKINEIAQALTSNETPDGRPMGQWLSYVALADVDTNHERLLQADASLGARMNSYEMLGNMLLDRDTNINIDISNNEDTDYAKAISEYQLWDNVYNAALKTGAMVLPMSLVEFL